MKQKHETIIVDIDETGALWNHRKNSFNKMMTRTAKEEILDMSINQLAEFFFNAGYYHGATETAKNEDVLQAAQTVNRNIEEQHGEK